MLYSGQSTTAKLAERFGMRESISILLSLSRLRWLGHVVRMPDIPKRILYGWLPMARPAHGVKLRWRDKVRQDLKNFSINDCYVTCKLKVGIYGSN